MPRRLRRGVPLTTRQETKTRRWWHGAHDLIETTMLTQPSFLALLIASLLSAGCVAPGIRQAESIEAPAASPEGPLDRAMRQLTARQPEQAKDELKQGLARRPSDANLHFLNALAYRELAKTRGQAELDLAETGFRLALEFDPEHWLAAWHLGLMQAEQKDYEGARRTLGMAARLQPRHPDIQLALAGTAYQQRDMPVALLAAERALAGRPDDGTALRIAAVSSAALGLDAKAEGYVRQLDGDAARPIEDQVAQWRLVRAQFTPGKALPQGDGEAAARDAHAPAAGAGGDSKAEVVSPHWSDCPQTTAGAGECRGGYGRQSSGGWGSSSGSYGSSGSWGGSGFGQQNNTVAVLDQSPLPALPAPCRGGVLPRMVVVDAMLIRTEEVAGFNQGINLLDGLKVVLTGGNERTRTNTDGSLTRSTTITRNIRLPGDGITYALNIFNGTDQYAEVLARPSLVALDRMPATFFSGSVITLSLVGNFSSNVADKPVGVSLAVTPTFIDDETVLLAVKAGRSFIDGDGGGSLSMSANSLSTNVIIRYGQTLVLSGLRERYTAKNKTGIPVLKDLPGIQYLSSNRQINEYAQLVMMMLTPRIPLTSDVLQGGARPASGGQTARSADASSREAREKLAGVVSNFDAIQQYLQTTHHYRDEMRTGEITPRRFAKNPTLERTLQDLRQMLYY